MDEIDTPWKRATAPKYQQQEKRTAKKHGAKPQINSGRTWSSLRDVSVRTIIGKLLIDNKTTEAKSYTITRDDWAALKRDANRTPPGCHGALQIDIQDLRLFIIEEAVFDEIINYARLLEEKVNGLEPR